MSVREVRFDPKDLPSVENVPVPDDRCMVRRGRNRYDLQEGARSKSRWETIIIQTQALVMPLFTKWFRKHRVLHRFVGFVPPGEPSQEWHVDCDGDDQYWTAIVPLTSDSKAGGTEFKRGGVYPSTRGHAYAFHGGEVHRGTEHQGKGMRIYVALVIVPMSWKGNDINIFS